MKENRGEYGELTSALPTADDQWWLVGKWSLWKQTSLGVENWVKSGVGESKRQNQSED
jgi:hypothetical protein